MCCTSGFFPAIFYSLAIAPSIIAVCAIAEGLRKVAKCRVRDAKQQMLCMEAIASFEMCANASELGVVADNYDLLSYIFYLLATSIWYTRTWENVTACPSVPIEDAYEGKCSYEDAGRKVAAQLAGGFAGLYYINCVYGMELIRVHRCRAWSRCCSKIKIPFIMALVIEAMFTCAYRLLSKYINKSGVKNANLMSCLAGILLVLVGREITQSAFCYAGGNLNPVLTTVTKFNCSGTSPLKHISVYWVGPCLGSIASLYAYPYLFK